MRTLSLCVAALLTGTLLSAQTSKTLPKGYDTTDGPDLRTNGNSSVWDGWRPSATYTPARVVYLYDSSTFPWAAASGTVITKLAVRRDAVSPAGSSAAHMKDMAIIMSTSTQNANAPNYLMDANHGTNKKTVMARQKVTFAAQPKPASGPAPFTFTFPITPFRVPANAKTFVIEIRVYDGIVASGDLQVDSVTYNNTGWNPGQTTVPYSTHCVDSSLRLSYSSIDTWPGTHFLHIWRSFSTTSLKPKTPCVAWLGTVLSNGIKIPGTGDSSKSIPQCELWVNLTIVVPFMLGTDARRTGFFSFGPIPNDTALTGVAVHHQAAFFDSAASSVGFALSRALKEVIGSGYGLAATKATSVYAAGTTRTRRTDGSKVDPDNEPFGRFYFRRAAIFQIN